jgi:hypothetical protein
MVIAVRTSAAPRSSSLRRRNNLWNIFTALIYAPLGVESCKTLVDEIVDGVMTESPGNSGNSGAEL